MEAPHAGSAARGQLARGVWGLRWFYRQSGYEDAINLGPARRLHMDDIDRLSDAEQEPYGVRRIMAEEILHLDNLDRQQCGEGTSLRVNWRTRC